MEAAVVAEKLVEWLRARAKEAGASGAVFGLSGGIDSAVVAGLAKRAFADNTLGVIMPSHSISQDAEHAKLVADAFGIKTKIVDLTPVYDSVLGSLGESAGPHPLAAANIKPRLRMITLYYLAQKHNYLVLGTGNRSELHMGYFTKYGDGGVDLLPIGKLVKQQVRELAVYLGVPQPIIDKPPSAGLWEGQTDEDEMGITYADLDRYILAGEATDAVKTKVDDLHRKSEHKRNMPPVGDF
ncbi:MAG: NAD+ synthase [Candidatus Saccharibacteria bacterium]